MNRREMLRGGGAIAGALVGNAVGQSSTGVAQAPRKYKIVVTGGHPGDPEYGCGGTIARLAAMGHEVVLLYLNDGAWEQTSAGTRMAEAKKACEILKARPTYAKQANGHAVVDNAHYQEFQKIIEGENPDAVFTHWMIDNHADHRAIANLTYEAWKQMRRRFALYYYEVSDGEDTSQFASANPLCGHHESGGYEESRLLCARQPESGLLLWVAGYGCDFPGIAERVEESGGVRSADRERL